MEGQAVSWGPPGQKKLVVTLCPVRQPLASEEIFLTHSVFFFFFF